MNKRLEFLLDGFYKNESGLSDEIIDRVEREIGFRFPADYLEVMRAFDGGEGRVGGNGWLLLFPLQEIVPTNEAYEILMSQIPDYFLFGKDSADTGYAFLSLMARCIRLG